MPTRVFCSFSGSVATGSMASDDELDFAAQLLAADGVDGGRPVEDDAELDFAMGVLAPSKRPRIGLPRQSSATAAYARVCRAVQAEKAKVATLTEVVDTLKHRLLVWGSQADGRQALPASTHRLFAKCGTIAPAFCFPLEISGQQV